MELPKTLTAVKIIVIPGRKNSAVTSMVFREETPSCKLALDLCQFRALCRQV
jgi:hypothetical protein